MDSNEEIKQDSPELFIDPEIDLFPDTQLEKVPVDINDSTVTPKYVASQELLSQTPLLDISYKYESNGQIAFLDSDEWWKSEWKDMPEFIQDEKRPWKSIYVHFRSREDLLDFGKLLAQRLTNNTPSIWYPEMPREKRIHLRYINE